MLITKHLVLFAICISYGSALECPKCDDAENVNECIDQTDVCTSQEDVCIAKLARWHISVGCTTTKNCQRQSNRNTTDCSGNSGFGPHDKCADCCTGQECIKSLRNLQAGLDKVSNTLHCPVCVNETDPQRCLDNFIPCDKHHQACEIEKHDGLYTSRCYTDVTQCLQQQTNANKLNTPYCIGATGPCAVCCKDHDCVDYVFERKSPGVVMPVQPSAPSGTSSTLTFAPPTHCRDQSLFPCHAAASDPCADKDVAVEFCPLTCGICQVPTPTPTPTQPVVTTTVQTTVEPTTVTTTEKTTTIKPSTTAKPTEKPTTATTTAKPTTTVMTTEIPTTVKTTEIPTTVKPTEKPTTLKTTEKPTTIKATTQMPFSTTAKSQGNSAVRPGCPNGWVQFEDSCYAHRNVKMTFTEAVEYCEANDAYLMEVETPEENAFRREFLNERNVDTGVWLGANDILMEGLFVWDRSEKIMTFTDWYPKEPTSRPDGEDCLSSWSNDQYHWADHYCRNKDLGALCEKSVAKCP